MLRISMEQPTSPIRLPRWVTRFGATTASTTGTMMPTTPTTTHPSPSNLGPVARSDDAGSAPKEDLIGPKDPPKELKRPRRVALVERYVDQNVIENTDNFWTESSHARQQELGPFPRVGTAMVIKITRPDGSVSYQLRPHTPRGSAKYVGMKGSGGDVHVAAASVDD